MIDESSNHEYFCHKYKASNQIKENLDSLSKNLKEYNYAIIGSEIINNNDRITHIRFDADVTFWDKIEEIGSQSGATSAPVMIKACGEIE